MCTQAIFSSLDCLQAQLYQKNKFHRNKANKTPDQTGGLSVKHFYHITILSMYVNKFACIYLQKSSLPNYNYFSFLL